MRTPDKTTRAVSVVLFTLGLLLTLGLTLVALWPDLEASLFSPIANVDKRLVSLRCPLIVTPNEAATISATFDNPTERDLKFLARARVSQGMVTFVRQMNEEVPVAAGESETVKWAVRLEDAAFDRLILARVYVLRRFPLPARDQTCGIFVMNVPALSGAQVAALWTVLAFGSLIGGTVLWLRNERPLQNRQLVLTRAFSILTVLLLAALLASVFGSWVIGLILVGFVALLSLGIAEYFLLR